MTTHWQKTKHRIHTHWINIAILVSIYTLAILEFEPEQRLIIFFSANIAIFLISKFLQRKNAYKVERILWVSPNMTFARQSFNCIVGKC